MDHSNQIGPEKVLCVLGVRSSQLPPPGTPLKHEDLRVLLVQPGTKWKREDMAKVYRKLAQRIGPPRAVLCDGAVELREGANALKSRRKDLLVLGDFKHFAANQLKSLFGQDERFQTFQSQVGRTRCAIQQTELSHLTSPTFKPKSRFMNLASILRWAGVISWLLKHPGCQSRRGLQTKRLKEKLGWLGDYAEDLKAWQACQDVVSLSLSFLNEHGLFPGVSACLQSLLSESLTHSLSRELAQRLIGFVQEAESSLHPDERLPISTEILESSFGLYKQLEGQQAKGGFTSLLAGFGALLKPATPESVNTAFARVKTEDVKQWIKENLGETLTTRRRSTYAEYKSATKQITTA